MAETTEETAAEASGPPDEADDEQPGEREARRRFVRANVRQYPDPALRLKTRDVTEFDEALATLVERMTQVMVGSQGVGLAAPQVGVLQRVLVYQPDEETEPTALVNARVVEASEETDVMEEGCLSLDAAGLTVEVARPTAVTVEARSPRGDELRLELEGLPARIVQHEIDHLDGVLIIDRTTPEQRKAALAQLRPQPVLGPLR
jgi:peptide deformylase